MNENEANTAQKGLVISYFGSSVAVEAPNGQVFQCHLRRNQVLPVVGDEVSWALDGAGGTVITGIEPRRTVLARADARGNMKPLAANVDTLVVVMAPAPVFSDYLVSRYLVAAEILRIAPIIVINKSDLLDKTKRQETETAMQPYRNIPYPVILTSAFTKEGLDDLLAHLKNKVAVLVGPSGVGKSSIISGLAKQDIRVNDVSPKGAGKHTTTATRFYHLPGGGGLIDSPGVREFNLWPVELAEILRSFKEFQPYLSGCKFRDCQHTVEPGCSLRTAVAEGKIGAQRFENYQTLIKEARARKK